MCFSKVLNEPVSAKSFGAEAVHCICMIKSLILNHKSTGLQHFGTKKTYSSPTLLLLKIKAGFLGSVCIWNTQSRWDGHDGPLPKIGLMPGKDGLEARLRVLCWVRVGFTHTKFGEVVGRTDYNPSVPSYTRLRGLVKKGFCFPKLCLKDDTTTFKFSVSVSVVSNE